jgi:glycosyltransferase involved in cell wall biosynthesis
MHVSMFSSWEVPCGIASYTSQLVAALRELDDTQVSVVPYDRRPHPRRDYVAWGRQMNTGQVAHVQHEYAFFGYRFPWTNHFGAFISQVNRPLVITRHVSFDGPLPLAGGGLGRALRQVKWSLYNRWLGPYAVYLNRGLFDVAGHIIVLSPHLKDQLVGRGIVPEKIDVIPPGVPAVPPAVGGASLRAAWGWTGKRVMGMFGFIAPAKGHLLAVEALAQLGDDYALLIAGGVRRPEDRPAQAALERRIAQLGLGSRVRITGYLPEVNVPAHISACDVLVYPSTRVDTSYSALVGLAYQAAPLVISDVVAHRELASQSQAVALFPNGDVAALAAQIRVVVDNRGLQEQLRANAVLYAHGHTWHSVAQQTRAVYLQTIAAGRAAGRTAGSRPDQSLVAG